MWRTLDKWESDRRIVGPHHNVSQLLALVKSPEFGASSFRRSRAACVRQPFDSSVGTAVVRTSSHLREWGSRAPLVEHGDQAGVDEPAAMRTMNGRISAVSQTFLLRAVPETASRPPPSRCTPAGYGGQWP